MKAFFKNLGKSLTSKKPSLSEADSNKSPKIKLQNKKPILIAVIIMIAAQMGTNFYLIALPIVADYFSVPASVALDTIYYYLIPYGISQLFVAPFVNRLGFRSTAVLGFSIFICGIIIILNSESIWGFAAGRAVQGLGGSTIYLIIRMLIQKSYQGTEMNIAFSIIESFAMATPAFAPIIGAYIMKFTPWQGLFYAMLIYCAGALICAVKMLNNEKIRPMPSLPTIVVGYFKLTKNTPYIRLLLVTLFVFAPTTFCLYSMPFFLTHDFGLVPAEYAFFVALTILGSFLGTVASKKANENGFKRQLIQISIFIMICAGIVMKVTEVMALRSLFTFILTVMALFFSFGVIFPNSVADAFKEVHHKTGAEVALFGFIQVAGGSFFNLCVTRFWTDPKDALFFVVISAGIAIFFLYKVKDGKTKEPFLNSLKILFFQKK